MFSITKILDLVYVQNYMRCISQNKSDTKLFRVYLFTVNCYIQRYIGCFHEKEIQIFKTLVRRKNRLDTKLMIHHLKIFYLVYFSSCYTHGRYRLLLHCLSNQDNSNLVNYLYDCTSHTGSNPCIHSNPFRLYLIL